MEGQMQSKVVEVQVADANAVQSGEVCVFWRNCCWAQWQENC